jgi:hypothetical protein
MNVWGKPEADTVCRPCLMRALEAAGIHVDEAIIEGVRMRDAGAATVSAPSYEINLPTEQPTEEIKPKRGRPKGSKNKKPEKTASEELTEALSRLETHKRKKQQLQQTGDGEVALETSKAKINRLNLIIWRILEHSPGPDYAQHEEWSDRAFATESEKEWLRSVDRKQPKLGDYYEAKQIEERIIQRRKKKWNERQGVNENKQTNSETGRSIGA